jgi:hypothetical protein
MEARRLVAADHAADLLADEQKIQARIRIYELLSSFAIVLGIIVPILAGSTVLASVNNISCWPVVSGTLTLIASVGVALHKGLGCDRYHARCHQALAELRFLTTAYGRLLSDVHGDDHKNGFEAIEARLDRFYRDYVDILPLRATRLGVHQEGPTQR